MTITDLRIALKYWADGYDISDAHLSRCNGHCCLNSDKTINDLTEYIADTFNMEGKKSV